MLLLLLRLHRKLELENSKMRDQQKLQVYKQWERGFTIGS